MVKCTLCGNDVALCGICNTNHCGGPVCVKHVPIVAKILKGHGATVSLG